LVATLSTDRCLVLFGIPTTYAEYRECIADPRGRDLISSQSLSWPHYCRDIVELFDIHSKQWLGVGVTILAGATCEALTRVMSVNQKHLVVIFSHSRGSETELFDGMVSDEKMVQLAGGFTGVIDLSTCNSRNLGVALRLRQTPELVKWVRKPISYALWFHIYSALFKVLAEGNDDYPSAMERVFATYSTVLGGKP
jgi:hypothetical protein